MLQLVTSSLNCVINFLRSLKSPPPVRGSHPTVKTGTQETPSGAHKQISPPVVQMTRKRSPMTVFPQESPSSSHPLRRIFPRITEDSQPTHVSNDSTRDGEQPSHPRLKRLMMIHSPVDLSAEVEIPDYRNPAKGGLADVYAGTYNSTIVAVKIFRISKSRDAHAEASNKRRIRREMEVWAALKHPNICELLGYSTRLDSYPALILEWCKHGNSSEYLDNSNLDVQARVRLTLDVCEGVQYLHQLKVIHGDLKPTNVLVDENGVAKLCDFGLVRLVDWGGPAGMTTTSPYTGTTRYKAPELFRSAENRHPVATFEGDIYSAGCIMLEFIEQLYPFQRFRGSQELINAITEGRSPALRTQTSHALSESTGYFWDLLESCWDEPSDRPVIGAVLEALVYIARLT